MYRMPPTTSNSKPNGKHIPSSSSHNALEDDSVLAQLNPEALGFEPILLLDDIFNVAQDAVIETTNITQRICDKWADERIAKGVADAGWTGAEEIEQGLVSLQTLLESHVDASMDMFDVWARRNMLSVPKDAGEVVLSHHRGLDLNVKDKREAELLAEIEELRRKKENMVRLNSLYSQAVDASTQHRARAEAQLAQLNFLTSKIPSSTSFDPSGPSLDSLVDVLDHLSSFRDTLAAVPNTEDIVQVDVKRRRLQEAEKRRAIGQPDWKDRRGYGPWALDRFVRDGEAIAAEYQTDGNGSRASGSKDPLDVELKAKERSGGASGVLAILDMEKLSLKQEDTGEMDVQAGE